MIIDVNIKLKWFVIIFCLLLSMERALAKAAKFAPYDLSTTFSGTYTVPMEQKYQNWSIWDITNIKWVQNKDFTTVSYKMPEDLMKEEEREITMSGYVREKSNFLFLKGKNVTGQCTALTTGNIICLVRFIGNEKMFQLKTFFSAKYKNNSEQEGRMTVAQAFSSDPIGVIHIMKNP